jgi:hypothetical protein
MDEPEVARDRELVAGEVRAVAEVEVVEVEAVERRRVEVDLVVSSRRHAISTPSIACMPPTAGVARLENASS